MEIDRYIVASDQRLVELALGGDSVAFNCLAGRYRDSIYKLYMQRMDGKAEDADDLVQETFIKVYLNLHSYNDHYTFGQWVYTIARNTFIDITRRRRGDVVSMDNPDENVAGLTVQGGPTPEETLITDQNRAEIDDIMKKVSPKYQKLIELRFFKEYSYEEIVAELKMPLGTVKTRIHRAREQLARLILENAGEE